MEKLGIQLALVLMLVFCQVSRSQFPSFPEKFRNPGIMWYSRYICRNLRCGFEEICDIRATFCINPPCADLLTCMAAVAENIDKGGRCPIRFSIRSNRIRCIRDIGCPGNELCCHGYRGSQCSPFMSS